jgi:glutathione peroxidase
MTLIICLLGFISTLFDMSLPGINGKDMGLSDFKGKKILLVNTASQNVLASQIVELQGLQDKFKDRLVVILVPSNNINGEEPLSNEEIKTYLERKKINLLCTAKLEVSATQGYELFQWLGSREKNGVEDILVRGNFTKILIGRDGRPEEVFNPGVSPLSSAIADAIER